MATPPCSVIIWTVCCPPSSFISAMISLAPSLAKVSAVALPIPEAPPVINATLPLSCPDIRLSPLLTLRLYGLASRDTTVLRGNGHTRHVLKLHGLALRCRRQSV